MPFSMELRDHLCDRSLYNIDIHIRTEREPSRPLRFPGGTAKIAAVLTGDIRPADDDTIIVLPCDTPHDIDLNPILAAHRQRGATITLVSLPIKWSDPRWKEKSFATIQAAGMPDLSEEINRARQSHKSYDRLPFELEAVKRATELAQKKELCPVIRINDTHSGEAAPSNLINTGIWIFQAHLLKKLKSAILSHSFDPSFCSMTRHFLPLLAGQHEKFRGNKKLDDLLAYLGNSKMNGFSFMTYILSPDTYWRNVNDPRGLLDANLDILHRRFAPPIDPSGRFWHQTDWGWQGIYGTAIEPGATIAPPTQDSLGSLIGSKCSIRPTATVKDSIILDNSDVEGKVTGSVIFPGNPNDRPQIHSGVALVNCVYVSGSVPASSKPYTDALIYSTPYGGIGIDPL